MQFLTTLLLAGLATAAPAAPKPFFLNVTSANPAVNAKCVSSYHTGAGLADAVIVDCGPAPSKLYTFKGTTLNYTGYGPDGTIPAALFADSGVVSYDNWGKLLINAGDAGTPFTYSAKNGFIQQGNNLGFIACQWSHNNEYQVFALGRADTALPSTCSHIKLLQGCYNTDPGCKA
jgi:hypothetical protein